MKRIFILTLIGAACVWALYAFAYLPLSCNLSLNALRARTRAARETGSDYQIALAVRRNLADLQRIEQHCPTRAEVYALKADNEDMIGRKEAALLALRRALTVDQRPELYVYLGTQLVEMGRIDEAVEPYAVAVRFDEENILKIPSTEVAARAVQRARQIEAQQRK